MKTIYKLTTQENTTFNNTKWIPGEWKKTSGKGELCSGGWLHGYSDPLVAAFMNPTHADIINPKLWIAEGRGKFKDDKGLKCGFTQMRVIKEIKLPEISTEKRIEIAIHCAILTGYDNEDFITWALHWMDGSDRSRESAVYAASVAAAWSAAQSAARDAANAALAAWSGGASRAAVNLDLAKLLHELCS